ncbi:MAG: HepT-like ribonuclease domain-containing protein [Chitinophagales bacterium]|nr:HepT-like ribonuclease domain-containing protein [Chitinophagales bacterium]
MSEPNDLIPDILHNINDSIKLVEQRISKISSAVDFMKEPEGVKLLDSISMRLQFIGESVRKIEKTDQSFLLRYPEIEWNKIINIRNFISHHY